MIIDDYLWLFVIIYGRKEVGFFVKNIFKRVTQNDKTKNSRFYDLKILRYQKLQNKDLRY